MTKTESEFIPAYLSLHKRGELSAHAETALARLEACDLCAHYCRVNRRQTVKGVVCRTGEQAVVHSFGPHHGEEDPLRDWRGSGTIFFSWCNLLVRHLVLPRQRAGTEQVLSFLAKEISPQLGD